MFLRRRQFKEGMITFTSEYSIILLVTRGTHYCYNLKNHLIKNYFKKEWKFPWKKYEKIMFW